jgi:hypothetical protein
LMRGVGPTMKTAAAPAVARRRGTADAVGGDVPAPEGAEPVPVDAEA